MKHVNNAPAVMQENNVGSVEPIANMNITEKKTKVEYMHFTNHVNNMPNDKKQRDKALKVWKDHSDYVYQKIAEYASVGLSIANGDYHFISYAGIPDLQTDYKGLLKVVAMEARKNGYQLIAKADTIRDGAKGEKFHTNGLIDNYEINNGATNNSIVSSYAILSLFDMTTRQLVMQKIEVLPKEEYENAKKASKMAGSGANKSFPTEMAKKIAFRRGAKVINTFFASDVLDKLFAIDNESYAFNADVTTSSDHLLSPTK